MTMRKATLLLGLLCLTLLDNGLRSGNTIIRESGPVYTIEALAYQVQEQNPDSDNSVSFSAIGGLQKNLDCGTTLCVNHGCGTIQKAVLYRVVKP